MSRVLAVDPGERRIGLALSDPTRVIARPLSVLEHRSRTEDARAIVNVGQQHAAGLILVGLALDQEGRIGPQARRGLRLARAIGELAEVPVKTWDESGSTQRAAEIGGTDELLDARAAAAILQDYLDALADPAPE